MKEFLNKLFFPVLALTLMSAFHGLQAAPEDALLFGALQSDPDKASEMRAIGAQVSTLSACWDRYEPAEGKFDAGYRNEKLAEIAAFRKAGMKIVIDLGMQYPPSWVFAYPDSRFVNQHGDSYNEDKKPGANGVNAVFNAKLREKQKAYVSKVFEDLGTNFHAVRLGWGFYGELCYPIPEYNGRKNSFWCYDNIAQGKEKGLPNNMRPCPVPGWIPGAPSEKHADAGAFIEWYMECMKNYHDWQIDTVRRHYGGPLLMLYPSWGVRPGQIEAAIGRDLAGSNGEITRGYGFSLFIAGIKDTGVIVYTTWIDSNPEFGDDDSDDPARWSPVHYLASLAWENPLRLRLWGENTGRGNLDAMNLSFERMRKYRLIGLVWAFEPDLYSGKYATLEQFENLISQSKLPPEQKARR